MTLVPSSSRGSSGSGTVTSVTAADTSIVVAGSATDPTIATATLDVIAADHPPAAAVAMNAKKITGIANGAAATDVLAVGQVLAANVIPVADLVAGLAGQVVGGTAPGYVFPPGYEIGYAQITSNANITDTAESTATALISSGALTFDGGAVIAEFYSPVVSTDANATGDTTKVTLFEGATELGKIAQVDTVAASIQVATPKTGLRFTPTAGVHTYKLCAFVPSTVGTPFIGAGAGGTGANVPAYIRFTKV